MLTTAQMAMLEKKICEKLLQLKSLKSCLTSIHSTMDGIDKQVMEANIELKNVLHSNVEHGVNVIDKLLKHSKAVKSIKPSMVELRKCVDVLIGYSKNKNKKQDAPGLKEFFDSSECSSLLPREQLKKLFEEGGQLNVTNESSLASAFVDLHTSYHDFEDTLIEKAVKFVSFELGILIMPLKSVLHTFMFFVFYLFRSVLSSAILQNIWKKWKMMLGKFLLLAWIQKF